MTGPDQPVPSERRAALLAARLSRRPSRLGSRAGTTPKPDRRLDELAGFPALLAHVWQRACAAPDPGTALDILLTLDGHVPAHVQLSCLKRADACALKVLAGLSWRDEEVGRSRWSTAGPPDLVGTVGLTQSGRVVVGVPSGPALAETERLVGGVLRVPWPAGAVRAYERELDAAERRFADGVRECRGWLERQGAAGRHEVVALVEEAALRTAPFVLYHEDRRYTNFREHNNLTGKTLWPGHPDSVFTGLKELPLALWSDADAVLVVCLSLLVRSSGFGRIEEANGTQVTLDHVAALLDSTRRRYNAVSTEPPVPAAASPGVDDLGVLADALRARRAELTPRVLLYREIHGPLMHKVELAAAPAGPAARRREEQVGRWLAERLPLPGHDLDGLEQALVDDPDWLARPHDAFGTGLESLIHATATGACQAFGADFAMSRGMRSLSGLVERLRHEDWDEIVSWELPAYFCCVVPSPSAAQHFDGSAAMVADAAWAMSARMQYNSWHFVPGNLPRVPAVVARDFFVPPVMPDLSFFSDQHHRGHVAAHVRFAVRSPQPVEILGRRFAGFVDLRLLRCEGPPFEEQDLVAAHRVSRFLATATTLAASLAERGVPVEVTAFDPRWHAESVTAAVERSAAGPAGTLPAPDGSASGHGQDGWGHR